MDIATVAVIACAVVALTSVLATLFVTKTLVGALRQHSRDHIRTVVAERKAELATSAGELAAVAVTEVLPDHLHEQPPPEPEERPPTMAEKAANYRRAKRMQDAFMDPDNPEEVALFEDMLARDLDPGDPEHVAGYNEATSMGAGNA